VAVPPDRRSRLFAPATPFAYSSLLAQVDHCHLLYLALSEQSSMSRGSEPMNEIPVEIGEAKRSRFRYKVQRF
jgi:hypothetical protein